MEFSTSKLLICGMIMSTTCGGVVAVDDVVGL